MLNAYQTHVAERSAQNLPPLPLSAEQVASLVELLKAPPTGQETLLVDLLENRTSSGTLDVSYTFR